MNQDQSNAVHAAAKQPVMVKAPCGFCGNNPPYMCNACNEYNEPKKAINTLSVSLPDDHWFV